VDFEDAGGGGGLMERVEERKEPHRNFINRLV